MYDSVRNSYLERKTSLLTSKDDDRTYMSSFAISGTHVLVFCVSDPLGRSALWYTRYYHSADGGLAFAPPQCLPKALNELGKPISFSIDRESVTMLIGIRNNDDIGLYICRLLSPDRYIRPSLTSSSFSI